MSPIIERPPMSRTALVTGAAGFVGRHMVHLLRLSGYRVHGVDIVNGTDVRRWFAAYPHVTFDLVVHCAAVVGGRTMIEGSPATLAAEDLEIDAAMWRWALKARPGRIVYFSSSAAYPICVQGHEAAALRRTMIEDDISHHRPDVPDQTYGWVKLTGERMAAEVQAEAGIPVHVFRPFSGYGADQDLSYPFPAIMLRALKRESPFTVWGNGTQVRDWVHINDVCRAVLTAVARDVRGPVNICTGRATSFLELATMAMNAVGYEAPIQPLESQPSGVHWRVGNPDRLHDFYRPRIPLEDGIVISLAVMREAMGDAVRP